MKPPPTGLPGHEARRLLQLVTGLDAAAVGMLERLEPDQAVRFNALVERRLGGEPLQYIEGTVQFGPVEVAVDRRALIPRPETEVLWERAVAALSTADENTVIVDMGTGSGALALALKNAFPVARVYATDIDPGAVELARSNVADAGVTVFAGDLFAALPFGMRGHVDLLISNPPYVAEDEALPSEVRDYEPARALFAGPRGDEVLERIAEQAFYWVKPGGWVFLEIGESQADRVMDLFADFQCVISEDLAGRPRILAGYRGATSCIEGNR
ncbi:MAG: peptide chain release factor N(5)-glutamine methyltransferase [Acidimicrobiia bacterium]|nr:peptide chain release factor N(5)-glutamine methyltransferase [Acidimicrobiia bacterium]